jgi:hypothetical protein
MRADPGSAAWPASCSDRRPPGRRIVVGVTRGQPTSSWICAGFLRVGSCWRSILGARDENAHDGDAGALSLAAVMLSVCHFEFKASDTSLALLPPSRNHP